MMIRARFPVPTREEERDGVRPKIRGECVDGPRPCPWDSCRYHLHAETSLQPRQRAIVIERENIQDESKRSTLKLPDALDAMPETCALDIADQGEHSTAEIAQHLGVSRQRVEFIEQRAIAKLRKRGLRLG